MKGTSENNKRIAKNTLALYSRTFVTMIVGLYTGRVMLQALGVDDFGIKSLVGAIISLNTLITGTMTLAVSRYITYSLGESGDRQMTRVFSTSVNAQIIISIIVVLVLEIIGFWFLNTEANIPESRIGAAHCVFQCSIIILAITLIFSPYNALIIAYEKMSIYAYASIVESVLALAIAFSIAFYEGDKLIFYSFLSVCLAVAMRFFYVRYCKYEFPKVEYRIQSFDKGLLNQLAVFSGWNLLNNTAWVFATQGISILINIFFGVVYNAARGLAETVNAAIQSFINSFTTAFSPQITKSYAANEREYAVQLANRGTKIAWLMMYVFIVPVCCEADSILELWLGEVPEMASLFLRFALFESLAVTSGKNLYALIQADGNVRLYTIHAALAVGIILPIAWILYYMGAPIWTPYLIFIVDFFALNVIRFFDLKRLTRFSIREHLSSVILPCIIVSIASFVIPIIICYSMEQCLLRLVINIPVSIIWTVGCCYYLGLTNTERIFVISNIEYQVRSFFKQIQ